VCVHGDIVTHGFGYWHEQTDARRAELAEAYLGVLTGESAPVRLPCGADREAWRPGRARGRLVGGLLNRRGDALRLTLAILPRTWFMPPDS
jgi:muramoyltetrapeptide carboxypeptidase